MKKIAELMSSLKMTIVSGSFLVLSLGLMLAKKLVPFELNSYLDPAWGTIIISGFPLVYGVVESFVHEKKIPGDLLVVVAMIASIVLGDIFDAGEVTFIMAIGEIIEDKTVEKAKSGLNSLINLTPVKAHLLKNENGIQTLEEIKVEEIVKGMTLRVMPGQIVPVDGTILSGNTSIDQSLITGEAIPIDKDKGDSVYAGTMNESGTIDILAITSENDSSLAKMINLVRDAESKKAPTEKLADKWASALVPIVIVLAIAVGFISHFALKQDVYASIIRAVTILVVFCPCSLILSTPTSVVAGIGQATKHGIVIKSGEAIEKMGKVNLVAFDKTGTLTTGKLKVSDIYSPLIDKEKMLGIAALIESRSSHPLGKALTKFHQSAPLELSHFIQQPGKGICAEIGNDKYFIGNDKLMSLNQITIADDFVNKSNEFQKEGKAFFYFALNEEVKALIAFSDTVRDNAKDVVRKLHLLGKKVVLLSGDKKETVERFANELGIDEYRAELLPEDKVNVILSYKKDGKMVAMIGDGVNDAPALEVSDVGIAMAEYGSDIATESADIALLSDDISSIPYLSVLASSTFKTIRFNIIMAMTINLCAVILSTFGILGPITGAVFHNTGSILVILNAARVYYRNYKKKTDEL